VSRREKLAPIISFAIMLSALQFDVTFLHWKSR
jgi:hypothetical protein